MAPTDPSQGTTEEAFGKVYLRKGKKIPKKKKGTKKGEKQPCEHQG